MSDPLVDLQFQDFGIEPPPKSTPAPAKNERPATYNFNNFPAADDEENGKNGSQERLNQDSAQSGTAPSFWTFAYYQRFFDVDTDIVVRRILNSMVPRFGTNFILHHIRPNPDLYGPFWIAVTLIFTIGIASNLGGYFAEPDFKEDYHWSLEFGVVTAAATAIFVYVWLVPLFLYGFFWWRKSEENFSFTEIICAYGYSLSIYVPISLLWAIPFSWFQWLLIAVGLASSGLVLVTALWPAMRHDRRLVILLVLVGIIGVNALMAIGFKMFFFHTVQPSHASTPVNGTVSSTVRPVSTNAPTTKVNSTKM